MTPEEILAVYQAARTAEHNGGHAPQQQPAEQPPTNHSRTGDTEDTPSPPPAAPALADMEDDLWERNSLHVIYTAALARMCSPWAVLGHCAARALTLVRPTVTLPALIGGSGGSLNWFGAVAAPSGGGKGSAASLARILVPGRFACRNLGSGEGMVGAYLRPAGKGETPGVYEAIMFSADEIDTITALSSRNGSTTMSTLRAAFAGETLGHSYVSSEKKHHLPENTYRLTLVVSVQPQRAGALLDDHYGGTPQRFQWFPGIDARITADRPRWAPAALHLPSEHSWAMPSEIEIPDEARTLILAERAARMRGDATDALGSHALFVREKFAYALAVLDGRAEMTSDDWRLAGIASDVSAATRDWVIATLGSATEDDATEAGRLRGIHNHAADAEKSARQRAQLLRVREWVLGQLKAAKSSGGVTPGALRKAANSRDRCLINWALDELDVDLLIQRDIETGKWSPR